MHTTLYLIILKGKLITFPSDILLDSILAFLAGFLFGLFLKKILEK